MQNAIIDTNVDDFTIPNTARPKFTNEVLIIQTALYYRTLQKYLTDEEDRRAHIVKSILVEFTEGLSYIHGKGIVHRDLKPANVFLDGKCSIKIGDFGLAIVCDFNSRRKLTEDRGTELYMAPEITTGFYDRRVDIYSFGVILFEAVYAMKTSFEKFQVLTELRLKRFPPDFDEKVLLEGIKVLIEQMVHTDPGERPTLEEIGHALQPRSTLEKTRANLLREDVSKQNILLRKTESISKPSSTANSTFDESATTRKLEEMARMSPENDEDEIVEGLAGLNVGMVSD